MEEVDLIKTHYICKKFLIKMKVSLAIQHPDIFPQNGHLNNAMGK